MTHKINTSRQELQKQRGREMKSSGKVAGIAEIERKRERRMRSGSEIRRSDDDKVCWKLRNRRLCLALVLESWK
jgi:hypothetical protein